MPTLSHNWIPATVADAQGLSVLRPGAFKKSGVDFTARRRGHPLRARCVEISSSEGRHQRMRSRWFKLDRQLIEDWFHRSNSIRFSASRNFRSRFSALLMTSRSAHGPSMFGSAIFLMVPMTRSTAAAWSAARSWARRLGATLCDRSCTSSGIENGLILHG
jgi:hypothetical protein